MPVCARRYVIRHPSLSDASGVSAMTDDALLIIEIQQRASQALRLPEDLDLMTGNPSNASIFVMMLSSHS